MSKKSKSGANLKDAKDKLEFSDGGTGVEVEDTSGVEIIQPFNPALIRVETKLLIIDAVLKRISHKEIELAPDFQRKAGIWSPQAQSRLIESILIRIPLPAFYMDATDENKWLVVDGLQRLTTLRNFVLDKSLKLIGLEFLTEHDGKTFDDLPREYRRRIEETQVAVYLIEKGTPPEVKFNVFKRINTGGLPLSPQEIRHALNQGPATIFLKELAEESAFLKATSYSIKDDRMADREFVLRFMAFAITPYKNYSTREDLDTFLNKKMAELNEMSKLEYSVLKARFVRAMEAARKIFGNFAFRKQYEENSYRYPINKALFEAWSTSLDRLSDAELAAVVKSRDQVNCSFIRLMNNDREFESAISQGTGDLRKVHKRFSELEKILRGIIDD